MMADESAAKPACEAAEVKLNGWRQHVPLIHNQVTVAIIHPTGSASELAGNPAKQKG